MRSLDRAQGCRGGAPSTGGGFQGIDDTGTFFNGNFLQILTNSIATVYGVYSTGSYGRSTNNTFEMLGSVSGVTAYGNYLDTSGGDAPTNWYVGFNTLQGTILPDWLNGNGTNSVGSGIGALDLCAPKIANCVVGAQSLPAGILGEYASSLGGTLNTAEGQGSTILGGVGGSDTTASGGNFGMAIYGGANTLTGTGSSVAKKQWQIEVLGGQTSSTNPLRLLADPQQTLSPTNCDALPNTSAEVFDLYIVGNDAASIGNVASIHYTGELLVRGGNAASTTLINANATSIVESQGTGSSASYTVTHDRTNGCLSVSVTAPNSDAWDWAAAISPAVQVQ